MIELIDQTIITHAPVIADRREALLRAFNEITGVSRKLLSMMVSTLLIGGDPRRRRWIEVGRTMVAVDTLVHNFLHRTGILAAFDAAHPYGQRCFRAAGCEEIIGDLAEHNDARSINRRYPRSFPGPVQHAIWRFCASGELHVCNGIDLVDECRCELQWCPLWTLCGRHALRSRKK